MEQHKNIRLLTWFNFFVDFRLYSPVAIIYFVSITGSYALGLSVFSVEMISNSLFQIPTGFVSDFFGRKKTIALGAIAFIIGLIFYAIAANFWILFVGAVFSGLAGSFYSGNNQALLHDSLKEKNMEKDYHEYASKTGYTDQIGLAISALLGSLIASYWFPGIMWLSIIPAICALVTSLRMVEPKISARKEGVDMLRHLKESVLLFKRKKKLKMLSLAYILDQGIGETGFSFAPAFINTVWPLWAIGISRMLSSFGASFGMRISHKLKKRFGYLKLLVYGELYNRLAGIAAVVFPTVVSPLLMSSTSVMTGTSWPAQDALFQKEFTSKQRATLGSLNSLLASLFFGIFAYAFGLVADHLKPAHSLLIIYLMLFSVPAIYWIIFRKKR
jgi:MFS family permease